MDVVDAILIFVAGLAAGTINAIVGSGTLITFPTLLALGYPPVTAIVSNAIGLAPGALSGAIGYRSELTGLGRAVRLLIPCSALGALGGGILLLNVPTSTLEVVVVVLIGLACGLVLVQPQLSRWIRKHSLGEQPRGATVILPVGIFVTSTYGGFFAAAQGILHLSVLGIFLTDDMQKANAVKNVLATVVNFTAAILFVIFAKPSWAVAGLIAGGSVLGGTIGARVGKRLPAVALRVFIAVIGLVTIVRELL